MTASTTPNPDEYLLGNLPRPKRRPKIERATRRAEAIALRRAGARVDQIAQQFEVHPRTVYAWLQDAIRDIPREESEELRALELDRLDAIFRGHFHAAVGGDVRSAEMCLRVMDRRARLLNLDAAPTAGLEQVGALLDRLVNGEAETAEG